MYAGFASKHPPTALSLYRHAARYQYVYVPGFGLGCGGSLRPGLVFCGGGGGGVSFLLASACSTPPLVSSSMLPAQEEWLLASRLPSILELSSSCRETTGGSPPLMASTVWLRGFLSGGRRGGTVGGGPGGRAMVVV